MNDRNHVSQNDLLAFKNNIMDSQAMEEFLEHICSCDYCSEQLAKCMEDELIKAPIGMKENIMRASRKPEVQIAVKAKEMSKRMQLFIYSLKVGTATVGALLILMITANFNGVLSSAGNELKDIPERFQINREYNSSLTNSIRENMDSFSNNIIRFSDQILNKED